MTQRVEVKDGLPFASTGEPTIDMSFPTTPGFASAATISVATAVELVAALETKLEEIDRR
jgi:hypothetical protein